jgi:hypothetical protein
MRPILYALLGVLLAAGIAVASAAYLHSYFHAMSAFYVPVGALFLGGICGGAYAMGMQDGGVRLTIAHGLAILCVGVAGCVAIQFAIYRTAYVTAELGINHRFSGVHVSRGVPGAGEPMTWSAFTLREAGRRQPGGVEPVFVPRTLPNPPLRPRPLTAAQQAAMGLEWLGIPIGAVLVGLVLFRGTEYCARCRLYLTDRDVCPLPLETAGASVTRLNEALDDGLDALLAFHRAAPASVRGTHAVVGLRHCPGCGAGSLRLRFVTQGLLGPGESATHRQTVQLPGRLAGDFAARLPAPPK